MKLPTPDSNDLKRSEELTRLIQRSIAAQGGSISFAEFMHQALYQPHLGYYSGHTAQFGRGGDFVTAPETTPLFAQCIARQCQTILSELKEGAILEIGAGSGLLAKDLLLELERLQSLPNQYMIIEISPTLRVKQEEFLTAHCSHLMSRIQWLDAYPASFRGIILANEVMDALPTHCFSFQKEGIGERCVTWEHDHFNWHLMPPPPEITERLQHYPLSVGYESEINLQLSSWVSRLASILSEGVMLLFDYGYGRSEYYHPDRTQGTLRCYYKHHVHHNPFIFPGLQDISAHVDFTTVAESATQAGLELVGFTTQTSFLLACGLLELAQRDELSPLEKARQNQAIKMLTMPAQMGEAIKAIGFSNNFDTPLIGFSLFDRIGSLDISY